MKDLIRRIRKKQGTGKLAGAFGLLLALTLIFTLTAAPAMALPQMPHRVWGNTTIEPCGLPVMEGAEVTAKIGETVWATGYVDSLGRYGWGAEEFQVPVDDPETGEIEGGTPGQTVDLYIEGIPAGSFTLVAGGSGEPPGQAVDLEVTDDAPPAGTILINGGDACTNDPNVNLALTCDDGLWGCGCDQMRFRNDGGAWSAWEDVATTKAWVLPAGDGVKTVDVEFRDAADNDSAPISDTITLDTTAPSGTISINGGAATTTSTSVTLTLTCDDGLLGCGCDQMQFRNDGGAWSGWEAVAGTKAWILTEGEGTKTVDVEFRDAAGNDSAPISDDIELILPTAGVVLINEFVSDPGVGVEWIELYNPGVEAVDLTDWTIEDGTGSFDELDGLSVAAGGYLLLLQGTHFTFVLGDSGDTIILTDNTPTEVDKVAYGDWADGSTADNAPAPGSAESTGRCPNGSDTNVDNVDFAVFTTPTPGAENLADPAVTTLAATAITDVSATLNGSLDELGCPPGVDVSFEWGITSGALEWETPPQAMGATGPFSAEIGPLTPDTMYYFRAKADGGTVYGAELSFTTLVGPPLMTLDLASGWNTFSVPLSVDPDGNTLGDLVDGLKVMIAYYFDGATQAWGLAAAGYVMLPCDAILIQMSAADSVPIYPNPGPWLSAKDVYAGWNLVGSSFINGEKSVDLALITLYYAEGELKPWGYTQVISPAYNQPYWLYSRGETVTDQNMLVGKGYYVSMDNPDEYQGQAHTPWAP